MFCHPVYAHCVLECDRMFITAAEQIDVCCTVPESTAPAVQPTWWMDTVY